MFPSRIFLSNSRKTGTVSGSPPEDRKSSCIVWRLAAVPFALPSNSRKTGTSRPREFLTLFRGTNVPFALLAFCLSAGAIFAQGNYEVQIYGSDTMAPGHTMVELHSNFTAEGSKSTTDGTYPTNHQEHETVEITQGWNDWFETGFYIFTSIGPNGQGYQWVGDHIRPRARVPERWKWPVGVSLSLEAGYQRAVFSADTWTLEIRPIIDKQIGAWYLAFNPAMDRSWHGPGVSQGLDFAPGVKVAYSFTKQIAGGFEYYGTTGNITSFDPIGQQQQQIVPAIDLDLNPDWEFNFGVGVGMTHGTDHLLVKMILGRRFDFSRKRAAPQNP